MYIVKCKNKITDVKTVCRKNGKNINFSKEDDAKAYADYCQEQVGNNFFYWTEIVTD